MYEFLPMLIEFGEFPPFFWVAFVRLHQSLNFFDVNTIIFENLA